jgi:putative OPT family oligopeptide transporter
MQPDQRRESSPHDPAPYVAAGTFLPEITSRAVVLGVLLSVIMAAANAYLGLFAGITVSASIPAAVISMAILRFFRDSNILENNIVQTSASAGESLAAGVIFTVPALIILKAWSAFNYWEVTIIAGLGGVLGVLFTIPLRRALIVDNPLRFPEGVATAEVLKVGETGGGITYLVSAAAIGALFKIGGTGLLLWGSVLQYARFIGGSVLYFGTNLSPALIGVGYIVGLNIAILIFLGGVLNWYVAIPITAAVRHIPVEGTDALTAANGLWSTQTRYLGVGAMVVGGVWALIKVRKSLLGGIKSGFEAYSRLRAGDQTSIVRTERDTPMHWVGVTLAVSAIPLFFVFNHAIGHLGVALAMSLIMLMAGFVFSSVAGYMAGLVGSSNNPISGVTIATILTSAVLLAAFLGTDSAIGPAAAVLIGAVVACAGAIAGDNMQDLKAGRLVGATPFKQQIMQTVGVLAAAFVMAPVLTLLLHAYGIGAQTAEHPNPLSAPQATLMAAVAGGVFGGGLPWTMVAIGMAIAVAVIALDLVLETRKSTFRTPVLAVAVGIYLPLQLSVAMFLGGLTAWVTGRFFRRERINAPDQSARLREARATGDRNGLLFAAGLITGEALLGIILAVPIVIAQRPDPLAFWGVHDGSATGVILLAVVIYVLYRIVVSPANKTV